MGANLVGRAIAYAVDVPLQPNEFRLLVGMCLTALDSDTPPRYFDSREASALVLGRRVPDHSPGNDAASRERAAAFQSVKMALAGLVKVGAIKRARAGGNGRRAEYTIVLDLPTSLSTAEVRRRTAGVGRTYPSGVGRASQLGYVEPTDEVGPSYPSGERGETGGQEEIQVANESTSPGPVDNSIRQEVAA
jgi:hypothetical protein